VIDQYIKHKQKVPRTLTIIIGVIAIIALCQTASGIELPNPVYTTNTHVKDLVQFYKNGVYFTDFFIAVHDQANHSNITPEQKVAWEALKTAMWTSISNSKNMCTMYKPMPMYQAQCDIDLSYIYEVCKLYPQLVAAQNPLGDASLTCDNPVIKQYLISAKHYDESKINGLAWKFVMNQAIFINASSSETDTELSEYSNFNP
jgi:hypothetical protein